MKLNDYAKMIVASIAMLMLQFQTMFAVNIAYNMPQKFWRAYTTYKYYSDAAKTQEITVAPSEDATVYVDYVFDSPFVLSDTVGPYWYHLRSFYANGMAYYYYTDGNTILAEKENKDGSFAIPSGHTEDNFLWAFYGDGYYLNLKNFLLMNH